MLRTAGRRVLSSSRAPSAARRVLVLDGLDPVCERHLNERGIETVAAASMSESALLEALPEFDGVVLQESTQITERVLSGAGDRLKIVGRAGVTVSNVDLDAATKNGVIVMNTPGVETNATAEMSMALIMAVCRQVPAASRAMAADDWTGAAAALQGSELAGKTVGIVGLGRIGQKVAKWCDGFGMRVLAYDPVAKGKDMNVEVVSLDKIWTDSDIVSLHVPYSADTHHLVDEAAFARCKQGVRIINSAFGGAVKESALADALDSGKCGGAALDVFEGNPLACAPDSALRRLLDHPSVVCTPHIGEFVLFTADISISISFHFISCESFSHNIWTRCSPSHIQAQRRRRRATWSPRKSRRRLRTRSSQVRTPTRFVLLPLHFK